MPAPTRPRNCFLSAPFGLLLAACLSPLLPTTILAVVTSDGYGTHIVEPGEPLYGIDHDGVAQIMSNGNFGCTGALLEGGMHVLTAGHCVNNENVSFITVRFTLADRIIDIEAHSWEPHPDFGTVSGTDVGIITLSERAPADIPRYSPLRTLGMDIDNPNYIFGYGVTGYAETGRDVRDGNKRGGRNLYEATGTSRVINDVTVGGSDNGLWLFSDFDSGLPENDGFGFHFGKHDLGFGEDEVYASSGDSGAPIFVSNDFTRVIAGVVSGGARFNGEPNADLDNTVNATWGQFSRDTRISAPTNLAFIESHIAIALESAPLQLVSTSSGLFGQAEATPDQFVYFRYSRDLTNWDQLTVHTTTEQNGAARLFSPEQFDQLDPVFLIALREPVDQPELPPKPEPPEIVIPPLPASGLIGSDPNSDTLLTIDPIDAQSSDHGDLGTLLLNGLAFDSNSNILYGIDIALDRLVAIQASTGQLETIGSLGVNFPNVAGLAFDPTNQILYATSNGAAANLYTVDTSTGAATEVGPLGTNVPGLAFNPNTSTLYGVSGQTDALYTIDTATGAATQIGLLNVNTSFCGLAYDIVTDTLYLSDTISDSLYSINVDTGQAALIGDLQHPQVNGLASLNKAQPQP